MKTQRKDSWPVSSAKENETKIVNYTTRIPVISGKNFRSVCSGRKVHEAGMLLLFQHEDQRAVVPPKEVHTGSTPRHGICDLLDHGEQKKSKYMKVFDKVFESARPLSRREQGFKPLVDTKKINALRQKCCKPFCLTQH